MDRHTDHDVDRGGNPQHGIANPGNFPIPMKNGLTEQDSCSNAPKGMQPGEIFRPHPVNASSPAIGNIESQEMGIEYGLQDPTFLNQPKGKPQKDQGPPPQSQPAG